MEVKLGTLLAIVAVVIAVVALIQYVTRRKKKARSDQGGQDIYPLW